MIITIEAKWRQQIITIPSININIITIYNLKEIISSITLININQIKLFGLNNKGKKDNNMNLLEEYKDKIKNNILYITIMGTPENELKQFENNKNLNENNLILNDLCYNFTSATNEWKKLKEFTLNLNISFINEPRNNYKLIILDLDHTILHFSTKLNININQMKRPYMDYFLQQIYQYYDIAIWSQTHWKWLEIKLIELGMLDNPMYRISFVLDKSSMFRYGENNVYIKPLHIIWSKFPQWGKHNTLHIDDLDRNFLLNPSNGIQVSPYRREGSNEDVENDNRDNERKRSSSSLNDDNQSEDNELLLLARYSSIYIISYLLSFLILLLIYF